MKLFRCSNPIGTVRLGKGEPLVQGQTYSMSLMLEVPDTQANEDHIQVKEATMEIVAELRGELCYISLQITLKFSF